MKRASGARGVDYRREERAKAESLMREKERSRERITALSRADGVEWGNAKSINVNLGSGEREEIYQLSGAWRAVDSCRSLGEERKECLNRFSVLMQVKKKRFDVMLIYAVNAGVNWVQ